MTPVRPRSRGSPTWSWSWGRGSPARCAPSRRGRSATRRCSWAGGTRSPAGTATSGVRRSCHPIRTAACEPRRTSNATVGRSPCSSTTPRSCGTRSWSTRSGSRRAWPPTTRRSGRMTQVSVAPSVVQRLPVAGTAVRLPKVAGLPGARRTPSRQKLQAAKNASAVARGVAEWRLDAETLSRVACAVAGRNLTRTDWAAHLADLGPYRSTCPDA